MSHLGYKHTCATCQGEFICPWKRQHCYTCWPPNMVRRAEVAKNLEARGGEPEPGKCICGRPIRQVDRRHGGPRPKYCDDVVRCRQMAYRIRNHGMTAADWRELQEDERQQNAAMRAAGGA